jgi:hypothetical protein
LRGAEKPAAATAAVTAFESQPARAMPATVAAPVSTALPPVVAAGSGAAESAPGATHSNNRKARRQKLAQAYFPDHQQRGQAAAAQAAAAPAPLETSAPPPAAPPSSTSRAAALAKVAPAGELSPLDEDDDSCVVCMDGARIMIAVPCGHRCLCQVCAESLRFKRCPACRGVVGSFTKVTA